ncbi:hypothetical protein VTN02DRAFT_1434 [Thermoascus thermophilus]
MTTTRSAHPAAADGARGELDLALAVGHRGGDLGAVVALGEDAGDRLVGHVAKPFDCCISSLSTLPSSLLLLDPISSGSPVARALIKDGTTMADVGLRSMDRR